MAGAASEAGTCSERDAADGVAGCVKGRSRCGAALALVPPLCATARPLCAARPDRAASLPLPTDTPPCAAVWRKRENRRPQNVQVNRGGRKKCMIKRGGRKRPDPRGTPPRRAGRGRFGGGHFSPPGVSSGVCFHKKPAAARFLRVPGGDIYGFQEEHHAERKNQVRAADLT